MGLANRDYFRDEERRYGGGGGSGEFLADTPTVRMMIIITIVTFLLQLVITNPGQGRMFGPRSSVIDEWFALTVDDVLSGQVWRLATYAFLHDRGNLWHLVINMLMVWWLGTTLERMYGSREFLWFYLTAAVFGGVAHLLWGLAFPGGPVEGASGVVMAILMVYAIHYPRQQIWIMGLIPLEMRLLVAIYILVDLHPILLTLGGEQMMTGIAHVVHLAGLLYGWLYYHYNIKWERLGDSFSSNWRTFRARRRFKVVRPDPEPDDIETELDRILAKISEHGTGSLTPREQATLAKASEVYKKKL
ncbi:MAG TPA: rhomboid family intramembrane serine protease [Planctomycetaceae bacterium]|nr:rhomboid family intramembrane serine protease [Planctomycetaceae bacterium]